ncbi:hypothetical protein ACFW31_19205 [Nocardiopsis alba]|uniref:hypothetical protein n=1 Tax=Nocardiopsis alba TaxID=53437 RepID=UPI00366C7DE5
MSRCQYESNVSIANDLASRSLEYTGDQPEIAEALVSVAQVHATLALAAATIAAAEHDDV